MRQAEIRELGVHTGITEYSDMLKMVEELMLNEKVLVFRAEQRKFIF
jgi:hypothetical protein